VSDLRRQVESLAGYLPSGRAFSSKTIPGTVTRGLLEGLAAELLRVDGALEEFRREILPDETLLFIDEWENAVGIPDHCFTGQGSIDVRRRDVLVKLVSLGLQTASDFEALAELLGVTAFVLPGSRYGVFPYTFPIVFFPNARAAFHTIIVDMPAPPGLGFPYTFPIPFGSSDQALVQCLFRRLKPAHVDVMYVTGFVER
jgi:uncharacterized protein YmfQ (DUF2313 family)